MPPPHDMLWPGVCLCVCLSVWLSVCLSQAVISKWLIVRAAFKLILHSIIREFWYFQNNGISLRNLVQNSELSQFFCFSPWRVDNRTCWQFSWTVASLLHWAPNFVYNTFTVLQSVARSICKQLRQTVHADQGLPSPSLVEEIPFPSFSFPSLPGGYPWTSLGVWGRAVSSPSGIWGEDLGQSPTEKLLGAYLSL